MGNLSPLDRHSKRLKRYVLKAKSKEVKKDKEYFYLLISLFLGI